MTRRSARRRMVQLENDYGYADTWPLTVQQEWDSLCAFLHARQNRKVN